MLNGHLLNERYQIKKKIGGGGMADVYLADDIILKREVAIKVLRLEYANDEEFIARFDREAQSATSISHPNIVNIYDVGEENQISFIVMEYVDGMTLKEYIQRYGPINVEEAIEIMKQITSAISHAHENGIVHRDIKPQNILIDTYGNVKVTDFGIAVALSATSLTQTNSVLGSVHYLSPEQARGGLATKKSDIYSLGIVFFELLTGRLPFSGQSPVSIALKHLQSETPSIRRFRENIPQSVENIVLKATTKNPLHRYQTVYEMEQSLERALEPDMMNEDKYVPPVEVGEETKAIPIITDNQSITNTNQDTIIHNVANDTINVSDETHEKNTLQNGKKKKRKRIIITVTTILAVLLLSGITALFIYPGLLQPKEVTIPDVIEWELEEAIDELESLTLEIEEELQHHEEIPEGHVIRTDPRPGRPVLENSTVTVYVSLGKEPVEFDDYVGMDLEQVKNILRTKGFTDVEVNYEESEEPEGQIIAQIHPTPHSEVVPSETTVIFNVSSGLELVTLNSLRNMNEEEVIAYLDEQELNMNKFEENSETVPEGLVIRHEPGAHASLEKGSTVDVYFSIGPKEVEPVPIPHRVSFVVSYDESAYEDLEEGEEPNYEPQEIIIYINDMNYEADRPAELPYSLTKEEGSHEFTIELLIAPDSVASYRVTRDGEEIRYQEFRYDNVSYEEEGD